MNGIVDPDALAAEYVLGTLDPDEHVQARELIAADAAFAAKVEAWERRLGELYLMVEPAEPDGGIRERIKAKLPWVPRPRLPGLPGSSIIGAMCGRYMLMDDPALLERAFGFAEFSACRLAAGSSGW